jgi:hypothetical protein
VQEAGIGLLAAFGQRQPRLDAKHLLRSIAQFRGGPLGMHDAASGCHQIHRSGTDRQGRAETITMENLSVKEIAHRGQSYMRMRAHIEPLPQQEFRRAKLVEKDEWPDHFLAHGGQSPAHAEPAKVLGGGNDHLFDGVAGMGIAGDGVVSWQMGHGMGS